MIDPKRVIIALDLDDIKQMAEIVNALKGKAEIMKAGPVPFSAFGPDVIRMLSASGMKTFLDLKFHDIPNTVVLAAQEAAKMGVFMLTLHAMGGREMMRATAEGVAAFCQERGIPRPKLIAVTVLTSHSQDSLSSIGISRQLREQVITLAGHALESGMDGVVASVEEAALLREKFGKEFLIITPGIRPAGAQADDQVRTATPERAMASGSSYLVVGRPVVKAADPSQAFDALIGRKENT